MLTKEVVTRGLEEAEKLNGAVGMVANLEDEGVKLDDEDEDMEGAAGGVTSGGPSLQ